MKTALFILLALSQVVLAIIPIIGKLYTETKEPNSYKITRYGIWQLVCIFLGLLFTLGLFMLSEHQDDKKRIELTEQLALRDSTHIAHLDSIQNNTIELLAKYGYKVDSSTNDLRKMVKDSSKTRVYEKTDPILHIVSAGDRKGIELVSDINGELRFEVQLLSSDASSTGFQLTYSILKSDQNGFLYYLGKQTPLEYTSKLASDQANISFFSAPNDQYGRPNFIFVWAKGQYRNADLTKSYLLDQVYYYNVAGNTFGEIKGGTRKAIVENVTTNEKRN